MPQVVPLLRRIILSVLSRCLGERLGELDGDCSLADLPARRKAPWLAGVANAVQATLFHRACLPAFHSNYVKVLVTGREPGTQRPGFELPGQLDRGTLRAVIEDCEHRRHSEGRMQNAPRERTPTPFG